MDWKEIEEKYPLSWKEFLNSLHGCEVPLTEVNNFSRITNDLFFRILYDFFDYRGIIISIIYIGNPKQETGFHVEIHTDFESKYGHRWYKHYYKTRKEAEKIAFKKAFEILENKLRGEK